MSRSGMLRFTDEQYAESQKRRARFAAGAVSVPERDVLAAVLELLCKHPRVAWARRMNTGMTKLQNPDRTQRFVRFGFVGCADIIGMLRGGRFLAVEVKADRGVVSDEQQRFIDAVNGGGGLAFVARSVTEVVEALR